MTFPRVRLVVSACLFVGWIGFLLYLVAERPSEILSRPQFLDASLYVVAEINADAQGGPDPFVKIDEVIWSSSALDKGLVGQRLWLPELAWYQRQFGLANDGTRAGELAEYLKQLGFHGPGKYLLPLAKEEHGQLSEYAIARIPHFGKYPAPPASVELPAFAETAEALPNWVEVGRVGAFALPRGPAPMLAACVPARKRIRWERLVQFLSADQGTKTENAQKKLAAAMELVERWKSSKAPLVVAQRWPVQDALQLQYRLIQAGVDAVLIDEAVRIYPLTPDARKQVQDIVAAKRL